MKSNRFNLTILLFIAFISQSMAQEASSESVNIGKSLGLYVFPSKGQDAATQDADELECYKWAMSETGVDPINPPQIQAEQVDRSADGSAVVGAARGAAAGAAIGAIAGDTGKGAAIGAVVGGLRGRRAKAYGDAVEQQHNNAEAEAQQKELMANFNKAYSACLEGKGYTVK
ncbi:glycine zipper family protein [Flexithrix dorotheae]|uniref:glycine zipper family protein n=1 Tax=Flexithrix dorotheae TaxID=70993 RepID=UPI0003AAF922|nr:glycine zipper family protein [Flexithrix dorotheae]